MSSNDRSLPPQRPGYLRQGTSTFSQKQKVPPTQLKLHHHNLTNHKYLANFKLQILRSRTSPNSVYCPGKRACDLGIGKVSTKPKPDSVATALSCLRLVLEPDPPFQRHCTSADSASPCSLDNSSQATTRPAYTTAQSHQSSARPAYQRQASAISTHSPSGRPHPPVYPPAEPKKPKSKSTLLSRIAAQQSARTPNPIPTYSNGAATSFNWRSGRPMAGMLEIERSRTRRERTFIGSECAVCEEPLEHTLRGERILQFSCGHVSHEACFYEYIKEFESQYCPTCNAPLGLDTSRGGNVLDLGKAFVYELKHVRKTDIPIEKLSSIVRSVSLNNEARDQRNRDNNNSTRNIPVPWDPRTGEERPSSRGSNTRNRDSTQPQDLRQRERDRERDAREIQRDRVERYGSTSNRQQHTRNESRDTGVGASSGEFNESHQTTGRRHDYDVQSMETALSSPRASITKNPIPAPTVTVRSEYPTLTRSRQQQSLTCLVTIEVPEGKWRPDPADLRGAPILPSVQQDSATFSNRPKSPAQSQQAEWQFESPEVLEEISEDLHVRVENWHGLDFQRYTLALQISIC